MLAKRIGEDPNNFLLAMPEGTKIISLIDQFNMALRQAGIERNGFGEKYALYSLRHFYAVMALRNGIGVFEVARNMGTSPNDPAVLRQAGHSDRVCNTVG